MIFERLVFGWYVGSAMYLQTSVVLLYGGPPRLLCGGVGWTNSDLGPPKNSLLQSISRFYLRNCNTSTLVP